jgi:NADH-quinone oxidoreductase subunit C
LISNIIFLLDKKLEKNNLKFLFLGVLNKNFKHYIKYYLYDINMRYQYLSYITSVELLSFIYRYLLVYNFISIEYNSRVQLVLHLNELETVSSIKDYFSNSMFLEREVYDLMGIVFTEHNDLRRILTDYGFIGNPLKKTFPLTGFIEIYYDSLIECLVYRKIGLFSKLLFVI